MAHKQEQLALVEEQIKRLEHMDMMNQHSDNFYYSSGRHARMKNQIEALETTKRRLQKEIERNS